MKITDLLVAGWMILIGVFMPFYMRDKREKIKGITYNQLVALCVVMVVSGVAMLAIDFFWKQ